MTEVTVTIDAIPDASTLPPGTRVIVLSDGARGRGFLAAFSKRTIARSARCNALLVHGFTEIGASVDPKTKNDLVFGVA